MAGSSTSREFEIGELSGTVGTLKSVFVAILVALLGALVSLLGVSAYIVLNMYGSIADLNARMNIGDRTIHLITYGNPAGEVSVQFSGPGGSDSGSEEREE